MNFVPEMEARRHLVAPYRTYGEIPADLEARWKAPYGPAEQWDLEVFDTTVPGPHGLVPVRVHQPRTPVPAGGRPGLVWFHGGAFSFGDLDMAEADATARGVAGRADAVVVSVDYRLCPVPAALGGGGEDRVDEHGEPVAFPVPHDDCHAAYTAVRELADDLDLDPERLAIGGASAGGNLAAGVTLRLADEGDAPWQLLLVYPVLHGTLPAPKAELASALATVPPALLFPPEAREAIDHTYLGGQPATPYAYAGLAPDLSHFPPTYLENAEFDVLRASGERFAEQLADSGVDVELRLRQGVPHGHLDNLGLTAAAATFDALAARLTDRGGTRELHVAKSGSDDAPGTATDPLLTIGAAAVLAHPGDTVVVHPGVYREWVNPPRGGTATAPITFEAARGRDGGYLPVTITGAEVVTDWREHPGAAGEVWVARVPNTLFGQTNPYAESIGGDWFFDQVNTWHTGEVYLDGKSMYESTTLKGVEHPVLTQDSFDPEGSLLTWYCEVADEHTTIWANFGGADPADHTIEINVRKFVFWPEGTGIDHITVRGFTLTKAATQWAPPTALQEGLIGPHWSKGWLIEDNTITDSKNVGVSLGKEATTGQNEAAAGPQGAKGGTQREREVIQRALALRGPEACEPHPWTREHVGSHVVRRNTIRDCEQAGIVGHMGAAFCLVVDNHISRIHVKRQWHGAEVAGIKLHAAIDTVIMGNTVQHTHRALWLDWQAQGTLVRRNVFYASTAEDFMVEVCHGPYLVEANLFLSPWSLKDMSTGGAYVHNYFAGRIATCTEHQRHTPYHLPHSTAVYGVSNIPGGDNRFYNNLFVGDGEAGERSGEQALASFWSGAIDMDGVPGQATFAPTPVGTSQYDAYPTPQEYPSERGSDLAGPRLPVWVEGNLYANGAESFRAEDATVVDESPVSVEVLDADAGTIRAAVAFADDVVVTPVTTARLGKSYQAEMGYTNPDGSDLDLGADFFGAPREHTVPGPFASTSGTWTVIAPGPAVRRR